ncbi:MAG: glycosyltransferase [Oscillospiraceae bacterium]|nr:glycosyltransferase [Oscillospiraceae bacterium]
MKIVHLELAGFYNENTTYQTNLLAACNLADGHTVTIVSSPFHWEKAQTVYIPPCDQIVENGIRLIRLPYRNTSKCYSHQKIRAVVGLYETLERLQPDVIMCHGLQFWSVRDVIRYKKAHPAVKLYADTHTDYYTSATNWLSLHILHRGFYRYLVRKALPYLEKYFCISDECRRFSIENYGVPEELTEFYPLGGILPTEEAYQAHRAARRTELGVQPDEMLLVHAGKLEPQKKTDSLLRAFAAVPELKAHLAVIGSIPEENKAELLAQMDADPRVTHLGWKSGDDLQEYLCATDLYCQPGKVSAIMQNAVCCRCPVLLYPHSGYVKDYDYGNVLWVKNEDDMIREFQKLAAGETDLAALQRNSERCAKELLDYRALAARLYR